MQKQLHQILRYEQTKQFKASHLTVGRFILIEGFLDTFLFLLVSLQYKDKELGHANFMQFNVSITIPYHTDKGHVRRERRGVENRLNR